MSGLAALLNDARADLYAELEQDCSRLRQELKDSFCQILQNAIGNGLPSSSRRRTRGIRETASKDPAAGMLQSWMENIDRQFSIMEKGLIGRLNKRFDDMKAKAGLSALTAEPSMPPEGLQPAMNTGSGSDEGDSRQGPAGSAAPAPSSQAASRARLEPAKAMKTLKRSSRGSHTASGGQNASLAVEPPKTAAAPRRSLRSSQAASASGKTNPPVEPATVAGGTEVRSAPPSTLSGDRSSTTAAAVEELMSEPATEPHGTQSEQLELLEPAVLRPTAVEWRDFDKFYERARSAHERDGVVLVKLPSSVVCSPTGEIKPEIPQAYEPTLEWSAAGEWARVHYGKKTYRRRAVWTIPRPAGSDHRNAMAFSEAWEEKFGPHSTGKLPPYAANIRAHDVKERARLGLPEKSPIYPLQGNVLMETAPDMQGVTLAEFFGTRAFGAPFVLHWEDFHFAALNCVYAGSPNWWLTVSASDSSKLLEALDRDGAAPKTGESDDQYLRHSSIFLRPRYLQRNQVPYKCFLQPQGYAVLLFPGTCHEGFRCGPNVAEADNYYPPGWTPPIVKECKFACNGRDPITRDMFMPGNKRKIESEARPETKRRRKEVKPSTSGSVERPKDNDPNSVWLKYIRHHDPSIPTQMPATLEGSTVLRSVLALWSRKCVVETCCMIKQWNGNESIRTIMRKRLQVPASQQLERDTMVIRSLQTLGFTTDVLPHVLKAKRSKAILAKYGYGPGNSRLIYGSLYKVYDIPSDRKDVYDKAYRMFEDGCRCNRLCGKYDVGLLVMISVCKQTPFHLTISDYLRWDMKKMAEFQALVGTSKVFVAVCKMSTLFIESVFAGKDTPVFNFEENPLEDLSCVPDEELLHRISLKM